MHNIKDISLKRIALVILFIGVCLKPAVLQAQLKDDYIKAVYIFNLGQGITWPNDEKIDTFRIGVLSSDVIYEKLIELSKKELMHGKPTEIIKYRRIKEVEDVHILYVGKVSISESERIYNRLKGKEILLIGDNCPSKKWLMINYLSLNRGGKQFEINEENINKENLTVSDELLLHGGTITHLRRIYAKEMKKVEEQKAQLEKQEKEIELQRKEIKEQKEQMETQRKEIKKQSIQINKQKTEIKKQKERLASLIKQAEEQKKYLEEQKIILDHQKRNIRKQTERIKEQQKKMEDHNAVLANQKEEMKKQSKKIEAQKDILNKQIATIKTQRDVLYLFIGFLILLLTLAFFIYRGYKIKKKINKQLEDKNAKISQQNLEISQQKEEIESQAEQLEYTNKELEKLSIVASKTDNAILITDEKGDFIWVNDSFTRLFGFTLEQLKEERGANIIGPDTSEKIRNYIRRTLDDGETVNYEYHTSSRNGSPIWVQVSLTPTFDDKGNLSRIIAVDTDISELKKAEAEIRRQKEKVEMQNDFIRGSIRYAKTIQQAILPIKSNMDSFFETFIIYRPKDIVSGDFYWFARTPVNGKPEKIFLAAVDCTGHGVPGAFMSMIGNRILMELISERHIHEPSLMLEMLHESIRFALKQDQTDNNDGMDVCLCRIEKYDQDQVEIMFAGAKRPLFYYDSEKDILHVIKGDRRTIGGVRSQLSKVSFSDRTLTVKKGDIIYLSTDGLIDQNAPNRKRFGTPRLREVLSKYGNRSMEEQKRIIEDHLNQHQQDEAQRDDITLVGIKFK